MRPRVQHPKVQQHKGRSPYWFFRYWADELTAAGETKAVRKRHILGPSKGEGAWTRKHAEIERDRFLAKPNAPSTKEAVPPAASAGSALFGKVAKRYEEGYLGRTHHIAEPTRAKESFYINEHLVPKWGAMRLIEIQPKAVEDWLHATFSSWWTMHGVRALMSRIYYYAAGHGLWEEGKRSPASKVKLGNKRYKYERRILSFEETARVLERLDEPNRLVLETCIATGARISEVLGLKWKHVDFAAGTIRIEERIWRQEIGRPKTEDSKRLLGIGNLIERFRQKAMEEHAPSDSFVFQQKRAPGKALWDSGVREALHQAAALEGCDFPGLGPHSFRRANISWRQEVGGSAIEACKIAGHSDLEMTREYTFVAADRQNELTFRIQQRLREAGEKAKEKDRGEGKAIGRVANV